MLNYVILVAALLVSSAFEQSHIGKRMPQSQKAPLKNTGKPESSAGTGPTCGAQKTVQLTDTAGQFQRIVYRDYSIETRNRRARVDVPPENGPSLPPVKVSYFIVRRGAKTVAKFDGDIYFALGNGAEGGLFPLLNNGSKQLILSQDIFRTGMQWVVDFSKGFRVIFDGKEFNVGRETGDLTISDLDGDRIHEITVPITTFYGFQGWRLSTSETPLPAIIFKYDSRLRKYLPANPLFAHCLLPGIRKDEAFARTIDQSKQLGTLMSVVLDYIFIGDEAQGWKFFEETCSLPDKKQIRTDMEKELGNHPVYRYIHQHFPAVQSKD
jgi:hypothetical protein